MIITILLALVAQTSGKKCHALAMSGGGSYGAFEAGVLHGFVNSNSTEDFAWDVVTGVSAGSINTGGVAMWKPGAEKEMVEWLSDTWAGIQTSEVFVDWFPAGIITGLLHHSALFNTAPGLKTLDDIFKQFDYVTQRKWVVTCVDVNTGVTFRFNETVGR